MLFRQFVDDDLGCASYLIGDPTSGEASLFGVNVREPIARQRIGYLPELTYYYKFLTAEEILRFYARIFAIPSAETERRLGVSAPEVPAPW